MASPTELLLLGILGSYGRVTGAMIATTKRGGVPARTVPTPNHRGTRDDTAYLGISRARTRNESPCWVRRALGGLKVLGFLPGFDPHVHHLSVEISR
jgi:hypothetical protein